MHIMVVPSWYASQSNPVHGSFFKEQFQALQRSGEKISVAYNEIWPITKLGRMKEKRGINYTVEDGLKTYRYKDYNYLPKNANMFKAFNRRMEKLYLEIVKKEGKVDIIHAHSAFWGGISAAYVAQKYDIPFVLTEHSSLKYAIYTKDSYYKWIKYAYDAADKIIAVGNGLKEELNNYTTNEITVIPNIIDFSKFKVKKQEHNKKTVLFSLGYLVPGKGMDRLIKAFKDAFDKNDDVILKIGADGELRGELEHLVNELKLQDKIQFLGALSREEVADEMNKCDGFILASEHETFGVVYIEALAVGKPVLGTKNGGAEDIIKDFNGILVNNKDHEALVSGLKKFVDEIPNFNNEIIREKCIEEYCEEVIVEKIKKVYNSL
ncbi:MAG: glycosyltransferase [Clostridiaceae bacterium]|nr:glycosyltransferase [Clostridiaceae bacterium]